MLEPVVFSTEIDVIPKEINCKLYSPSAIAWNTVACANGVVYMLRVMTNKLPSLKYRK
jgi:hypothetical protein